MTLATLAIEDFTPEEVVHDYEPQPDERRRSERRRLYETHWLTMSSNTAGLSSFLVARVVDISSGGFGLCTLEPVQPGHEYSVAGEVFVDGQRMEISTRACVVYCKPSEEETYAVGLETSGLSCWNVPKAG